MDDEEDGNVYLKQVVVTLKALNKDIDSNLQVMSISHRLGRMYHTWFRLGRYWMVLTQMEKIL